MVNLQLFKAYIQHQIQAKTRHGVHSPFVYKLVDQVIYNFKPNPAYDAIEGLRKILLTDSRSISVTDLGAGSHINNRKRKEVKQIAKNALKPKRLAQLIFRLANERNPGNIIELGTCLGLTTAYLAKSAPAAQIISIEGCQQTASIAKENLKYLNINNVELRVGNFDVIFPEVIKKTESLDIVFVDGNHRKEATLNYFYMCLSKITPNTLLIFDDIYWSKGMTEAWDEIKRHPKVKVTIDLFWIGLVYFKEDQAMEHFKIKF